MPKDRFPPSTQAAVQFSAFAASASAAVAVAGHQRAAGAGDESKGPETMKRRWVRLGDRHTTGIQNPCCCSRHPATRRNPLLNNCCSTRQHREQVCPRCCCCRALKHCCHGRCRCFFYPQTALSSVIGVRSPLHYLKENEQQLYIGLFLSEKLQKNQEIKT